MSVKDIKNTFRSLKNIQWLSNSGYIGLVLLWYCSGSGSASVHSTFYGYLSQ